jgi:hypothetical protein
VADRTFLFAIGFMNLIKGKVGSVGRMGRVTRCAINLAQRKPLVLSDQACSPQIMAAGAQDPRLIPESQDSVATVGVMTLQAFSLGKGFVHMGEFLLGLEIRVTGPAKIVAGRGQEVRATRAMGIMAFLAASFLDRSMSKLGNRNQVSRVMAFGAGVRYSLGTQQVGAWRSVWVVAITACTVLERRVQELVPSGCKGEIIVTVSADRSLIGDRSITLVADRTVSVGKRIMAYGV